MITLLLNIQSQVPKDTDRVVYLAGAWDMFHAGHIETLEKAKKCVLNILKLEHCLCLTSLSPRC